jgi:RimJ/RimL family protein N-acetyltransferase
MVEGDLFCGDMVRLIVDETEEIARALGRWSRDSEYWRLASMDDSLPRSEKLVKEWIEKIREKDPFDSYRFSIRKLTDNNLIGDICLDIVGWHRTEAFVGISIGEREEWGKGYGSDAMHLILRYAFLELNLKRVSLDVFSYNQRAIRSYEKAGFIREGCQRGMLLKDGQRYDMLFMGILREEWLEKGNQKKI